MSTVTAPVSASPYPLLLRLRPVRTLWIGLKVLRYVMQMGVRQVCWLVEAFEQDHGHWRSRCEQLPVDQSGRPLPWYTYPAIQYLSQIDLSDRDGFEFGSGNGSLFWAGRLRSLVSVEGDQHWHEMIGRRKAENQQVLLVEDLDEYPRSIARQHRSYDLIIVDGKRRRDCAREALRRLSPGGMIILDNADWYPNTARLLREAGLIQVDFTGFGPVNNYAWTTSLFLHPQARIRPSGDRLPVPGLASLSQTSPDD
jgi:hypothetical protein